jgi:hypothetical protein
MATLTLILDSLLAKRYTTISNNNKLKYPAYFKKFNYEIDLTLDTFDDISIFINAMSKLGSSSPIVKNKAYRLFDYHLNQHPEKVDKIVNVSIKTEEISGENLICIEFRYKQDINVSTAIDINYRLIDIFIPFSESYCGGTFTTNTFYAETFIKKNGELSMTVLDVHE